MTSIGSVGGWQSSDAFLDVLMLTMKGQVSHLTSGQCWLHIPSLEPLLCSFSFFHHIRDHLHLLGLIFISVTVLKTLWPKGTWERREFTWLVLPTCHRGAQTEGRNLLLQLRQPKQFLTEMLRDQIDKEDSNSVDTFPSSPGDSRLCPINSWHFWKWGLVMRMEVIIHNANKLWIR